MFSCDRNYCTNGGPLDPGLPGDWERKTLECGCEVMVCPSDLRYFRHEGQPGMGCYLDPCKVDGSKDRLAFDEEENDMGEWPETTPDTRDTL